QKYRYVGGAVGIINYDAIRLWEKIPDAHKSNKDILMEFGVYTDGILYDNKRIKGLSFNKTEFDEFSITEIFENLNKERFTEMVNQSKKYIHDGDIFQVVLSRKFNFEASG